jgi:hypothetical protein
MEEFSCGHFAAARTRERLVWGGSVTLGVTVSQNERARAD